MKLNAVAVLVSTLAIAACNQEGPVTGAQTTRTAPPGFACPPAGTTALSSTGTRTNWRGADPADPGVCLVTTVGAAGETQQRRFLNYWIEPNPGSERARAAFRTLFPLELGKSARFSRFEQDALGVPVTYEEQWRVLRRERIEVAGQPRDAFVVERLTGFATQGAFRAVMTLWFDAPTGIVLRQDVSVMQGTWRGVGPAVVQELRVPGV
jgi:hypothetical protein